MIKVSHIEIGALVDFVKNFELQPDWLSMQLPNGRWSRALPARAPIRGGISPLNAACHTGRNLNQCMRAAQNMGLMHLQPPIMPPMKRKSPDTLGEPAQKRLAITPVEPQPMNYHHPRIQPRPLQPQNGYQATPPAASPTVPQASIGRKRGRPSKADKEAQARANAPVSFAHPTTPVPLAPHPPPPRAQMAPTDFSANPSQPPFYHISPGPGDPKPKKKGGRAPSMGTTQPVSGSEPPASRHQACSVVFVF